MLEAARAANLSGDPDFGAALASQAWETGHMIEAALLLARAHTIRRPVRRCADGARGG
jgi:hypothetical protein